MKNYAIIVAGGVGKRMGLSYPKQFFRVNGKPILLYTLEKFLAIKELEIILVLPEDQFTVWQNLVEEFNVNTDRITIKPGGEERFYSVKSGLTAVDVSADLVAVHDAVRPFVSTKKIEEAYFETKSKKAVVLAVQAKDSVRKLKKNGSEALNRADIYLVQTPQIFKADILKKAYDLDFQVFFTDDASVVENAGYSVSIITGETTNIKITSPEDLDLAEILLKTESK